MKDCVHGVTEEAAEKRFAVLTKRIEATPEDDHDAQWSVVAMCGCCCGPVKLPDFMCSYCKKSS